MLRQIHDLHEAAALRRQPGNEIVAELGQFARRSFERARRRDGGIIPVVIPAHDEEADLPATLAALARTEALPIVVDNRSTDATSEIARSMGAVVVPAPEGRRMGATQTGIKYVLEELGVDHALFTDADTLVPRRWAAAMHRRLTQADRGKGAVVFGSGITWHGNSKSADAIMSASRIVGATGRMLMNRPRPIGYNYGLLFDPEGQMERALMELDPNLLLTDSGRADDEITGDAVRATEAAIVGPIALDTHVITRGDRVSTLGQALAIVVLRKPYWEIVSPSFRKQYGHEHNEQ